MDDAAHDRRRYVGKAKTGSRRTELSNAVQTQQMVETVKTMFPHIPEPSIRYDLLRSGSAEATCERILQDGYLPMVRGHV